MKQRMKLLQFTLTINIIKVIVIPTLLLESTQSFSNVVHVVFPRKFQPSSMTTYLTSSSSSTNLSKSLSPTTRRNILQKSFLTFITTTTATTYTTCKNANALEQCRPKARNCIRTAWEAPSSTIHNIDDAVIVIKNVLNSYPQNGQNGVDCNGWSVVKDDTVTTTSTTTSTSNSGNREKTIIALEYKSCIGPAALAINLAQPFIDDVILEFEERKVVEDKNDIDNNNNNRVVVTVQVKSSSRMGSSDLNVNKKRIEYLGEKLHQQGWIVPRVKYGA